MASEIRIRPEILEDMMCQARREPAIECCGLLAGLGNVITKIFPATNALASPTAYEIAPVELFKLFRQIRAEDLDHLGIYHSHPAGQNVPSPSDIEMACYPDQAYFIISSLPGAARPIRAFSIRDARVEELKIEIVAVNQ